MNESHAKGIFDEAKGKIKQAFGEATNDQETANSGAVDQVKGHAEQTWGNVKDTVSDLNHSNRATEAKLEAEEHGHNLRESITSGAENLKNSISRGLDNLKHDANRP